MLVFEIPLNSDETMTSEVGLEPIASCPSLNQFIHPGVNEQAGTARHASAVQDAIVSGYTWPIPEHFVAGLRPASKVPISGPHVSDTSTIRTRIVRGAVSLEGFPLSGVVVWREIVL